MKRAIKLSPKIGKVRIAHASQRDREVIYQLRHEVYANELRQHLPNSSRRLTDKLDESNVYITAEVDGKMAGFISLTPPECQSYSIDKYFSRDILPFNIDDKLYEIRILTVLKSFRGSQIAGLLMYAAFRWVEEQGGTRIVAVGRSEILNLYLKVGLKSLGHRVQSGAVTYELLSETTSNIRAWLSQYEKRLRKLEDKVDWKIGSTFYKQTPCFHGGAFFKAIGEEFDDLDRRHGIINADVLDAWFPPSPKVIRALQKNLSWLLHTSPPTGCEGLIKTIARIRGINTECILPGAGSSDLIFLGLQHWLTSKSKVLILDPTYGEYVYFLKHVLYCQVDSLILSHREGYVLDPSRLKEKFKTHYDMIILVNPNSPTGRHVPKAELETVLKYAPANTLIWVDETYVEYAGANQSLEHFAVARGNIVVCKSMSKVYALSGVRVAYLCASSNLINTLKRISPPWAVSLPAQVAAVMALQDPDYYAKRYEETQDFRKQLVDQLNGLSKMDVIPSIANFVLCHLPNDGPDAATVINECKQYGLFLRDVGTMGTHIGTHALRIAVKDKETNMRIAEILRQVLSKD